MKLIIDFKKDSVTTFLCYGLLSLFVIYTLFPLYWAFSLSIRIPSEIFAIPPKVITRNPTIENYLEALFGTTADINMVRFFVNSIIVSVSTSVIAVIIATGAAYCFARYASKKLDLLFYSFLGSYMVPGIFFLLPLFKLFNYANILDTYLALIIASLTFTIPLATWILRNFISDIPYELEEAAQIDGCSKMGAFVRVVFPLLAPGLMSVVVLTFIIAWNDLLFASVLAYTDATKTIQIGIFNYAKGFMTQWGPLMATTVLATVPGVVLFTFLSKYLIRGLASGALKG